MVTKREEAKKMNETAYDDRKKRRNMQAAKSSEEKKLFGVTTDYNGKAINISKHIKMFAPVTTTIKIVKEEKPILSR